MIVFDLTCLASGHRFEAWFASAAEYDRQRAAGLVMCPTCGGDRFQGPDGASAGAEGEPGGPPRRAANTS